VKRFAVIGDPIAHSLSPRMHAAAYAALGLPHRYEALKVTDAELPRVMDDLRAGRLDGCNVTVPHKGAVLTRVDRIAPIARSFGAANTLVRAADGAVEAHNTDIPALVAEIAELGHGSWRGATALVLGSGGAARAAIAALCTLRFGRIVVRARSSSAWLEPLRAETPRGTVLEAEGFGAGQVEATTALVIQATSLGLPHTQGELAAGAIAWSRLPRSAPALDLVYGAAPTPFLQAARAAGLRAHDGRGMLARQGALAFERWLGIRAPLYTMWSALL